MPLVQVRGHFYDKDKKVKWSTLGREEKGRGRKRSSTKEGNAGEWQSTGPMEGTSLKDLLRGTLGEGGLGVRGYGVYV